MNWTRETVRAGLLEVFGHHAQAGVKVDGSSRIVADLGIDSLGVMEVIADIEDKFELQIPDDALREVESIGDVIRAIEAKLEAAGRLRG